MPMAKGRKEHIVVERHTYAELILFEVTDDELEQLKKEALTVGEDFSFFLVGISVAITVTVTLLSVQIESNRVFEFFVIVAIIGFLMTAYFGIRWYRKRNEFKEVIERIRSRVAPLGEEGEEIDPSDELPVLQQRPGGHQ
jgi:hypothetical protein